MDNLEDFLTYGKLASPYRRTRLPNPLTWQGIHACAIARMLWIEDTGRFLKDQRVCELEIWDKYCRRRIPWKLVR